VSSNNSAGVIESRIWTFTYNAQGQVLTENGPRTDVTDVVTYTYNPDGTRASMTDALGHTTNYTSYDASGKLLSMRDANGLVTDYVYDQRDRMTDAKVKANAASTVVEVTHYDYTPTGSLDKLTLPDGSFLSYAYDDADRLIGVTDNLDNSVSYTLNGNGDRISEVTKDPANALVMTMGRAIDALGRVQSVSGAEVNEISTYTYNGNGNEKTATDPNLNLTSNEYDALDRLTQVIDPNQVPVGFKYDPQDNLVEVSDPRQLKTTYAYSGFDELSKLTSPDTAVTDYGYDIAGNLVSRKDARGITATYQYDAANRLKQINYPATPTVTPAPAGIQTAPAETIRFTYDEASGGPGAKGLLTTVTDASGSTKYQYDAFGQVTSKAQVVGSSPVKTQLISYLPTGQINEHTLPSGAVVKYSYRADCIFRP
jgi:YD repeat-containing protein